MAKKGVLLITLFYQGIFHHSFGQQLKGQQTMWEDNDDRSMNAECALV